MEAGILGNRLNLVKEPFLFVRWLPVMVSVQGTMPALICYAGEGLIPLARRPGPHQKLKNSTLRSHPDKSTFIVLLWNTRKQFFSKQAIDPVS